MKARLMLGLAVILAGNLAFSPAATADLPSEAHTSLHRPSLGNQADRTNEQGQSENMKVIGHLGLGGSTADVYGFGDYAYLGVRGGEPPLGAACRTSGVKVVDISRPDQPRQVAVLQ
ncbi:MAG: hypothetical protein M3O70_13810, partial [Actinomycetota bacterium]|nr:hypothetical protein [Actinomycetota bacterium]